MAEVFNLICTNPDCKKIISVYQGKGFIMKNIKNKPFYCKECGCLFNLDETSNGAEESQTSLSPVCSCGANPVQVDVDWGECYEEDIPGSVYLKDEKGNKIQFCCPGCKKNEFWGSLISYS